MSGAEYAMAEVSSMIRNLRIAADGWRPPGVGCRSDVDQASALPYDEYKYLEKNCLRPLFVSLFNEADGALNYPPGVGGRSDVDQASELPYDEYKYLENNCLRPLLLSLFNEAAGALNHALRVLELAKKEEEAEVAKEKEKEEEAEVAKEKKKEEEAEVAKEKKEEEAEVAKKKEKAAKKKKKADEFLRKKERGLGQKISETRIANMWGDLIMYSPFGELEFHNDKESALGEWVKGTKEVVRVLAEHFTGNILTFCLDVELDTTSRGQESFPVIDRIVLNQVERKVKKVHGMVSDLRKILVRSYGEPISSDADSFIREEKLRAWRLAYSRVDCVETDVVGIEENVQELVTQLTKDYYFEGRDYVCRHQCFSIYGMGGIGKTTLAKQIYHHTQIRSHFDALAWVPVSDHDVDLVDLLNDLEKQIRAQLPADERKPKTFEKDKKYLVILDNIWSDRILTKLSDRLSGNIKFLFTTRNGRIGLGHHRHELRCLEEKQSWELFEKKANFRRNASEDLEDYNERKELAQRMLECCAGLPLAITVLGELLSDKHTIDEFLKVFHNNFKAHLRGGKGNELGELNFSYISWVLSLSYQEVPVYLKPCLMHLAQFPKDCEIRVKELSRMWMAEGLLTVISKFADLKKEAQLCILELVERCVIQVEKFDFYGLIKTVRIHNLMREFCLLRAKEESFQEVIDSRNRQEKVDSFSSGTGAYVVPTHKPRIALYLNEDVAGEFFPLFNDDGAHKQLSSLICFSSLPYPSYEKVMERLLNCFHNLRVLKFENLTYGYIGKLPEAIGELLQLRFLSLKGSHVEQVPSSIENLTWLQHFDLRTNWDVELPNVIGKLEKLRHFYLPRRCSVSGNKLSLGTLMQLQTLVNVPGMYCDINDLKVLTQVTKLKIYFYAKWWKDMDPEIGSLVFDHLRSLALENLSRAKVDVVTLISRCLRIRKLQIEGKIVKLPEDKKFFPRLIKLTLIRTDLEDDPMGTLEKLPYLRILILNYNSFKGKEMVCSNGGFRALEYLSVIGLDHLKEWRVEERALPILSYFLIEDCSELKAIPDGVKCVTTLRKLVVKRMSREFKMKIEERGEDFYKVKHVAAIELLD